ncbi:MAG: YCF48-related protein [Pseudomonas sp.]
MLLRPLLAAAGLLLCAQTHGAQPTQFDYPIKADHVFLLGVANTGQYLVAVGERGVVLLADEHAEHWQAVRTPSTRTLAGVAFASPQIGVAVGHGGTLLRTVDAGASWQAIDCDTSDALLGVAALGEGRMAAWGAFGLYLLSRDNGASWERIGLQDGEFDRHISQIIRLADGTWLMVGESGTLATSHDQGENWQTLPSPYAGSLFGALQTQSGELLVFGMRGNLWGSADGGLTWSKRPTGTTLAFNGAAQLPSGRILVFGNSGLLLASDDQGQNFHALTGSRASLAKGLPLADGRLLAVGDRGVSTLELGQESTP